MYYILLFFYIYIWKYIYTEFPSSAIQGLYVQVTFFSAQHTGNLPILTFHLGSPLMQELSSLFSSKQQPDVTPNESQ